MTLTHLTTFFSTLKCSREFGGLMLKELGEIDEYGLQWEQCFPRQPNQGDIIVQGKP
jgi:hypothetical protein